MKGNSFSIIPLTTHIPLKKVSNIFLEELENIERLFLNLKENNIKYKNIIFLGINPHAGEDGTLGKEDEKLKLKIVQLKSKFKILNLRGQFQQMELLNLLKKIAYIYLLIMIRHSFLLKF